MLSVRTAEIDSLKPVYRCSLANSNIVYRLGFQKLKRLAHDGESAFYYSENNR